MEEISVGIINGGFVEPNTYFLSMFVHFRFFHVYQSIPGLKIIDVGWLEMSCELVKEVS